MARALFAVGGAARAAHRGARRSSPGSGAAMSRWPSTTSSPRDHQGGHDGRPATGSNLALADVDRLRRGITWCSWRRERRARRSRARLGTRVRRAPRLRRRRSAGVRNATGRTSASPTTAVARASRACRGRSPSSRRRPRSSSSRIGARPRDHPHGRRTLMSHLDSLDLSSTSHARRPSSASRLPRSACWRCGSCSAGSSASGSSARRCACCSRGGTRRARAARSSAWSAASTRATCASCSTLRRPSTRSATTGCGASGRRCRAGAAWPCSIARGTGACWSSASRASPPRRSGSARTARSTSSSGCSRDEGTILIKFWLHISSKEQLKRFEARERDPLKQWKLTDEDWRNRKKRTAYNARRRGHGRADRHRVRAWYAGRGRLQALRAREGGRDGERRDRGRHAPARESSRRRGRASDCGASSCAPGVAPGPSRAPWPSPGACACAGPPRAGGAAAAASGTLRRASRTMTVVMTTKQQQQPDADSSSVETPVSSAAAGSCRAARPSAPESPPGPAGRTRRSGEGRRRDRKGGDEREQAQQSKHARVR